MLESLTISNFALIEKCEIEFSGGFNVVTGESGAGKSILMSAAALLFGGRADLASIRTGAPFAEISGTVGVPEMSREKVSRLLEEAEIPVEFPLTIRRKIMPSGVRNFVNDTSCGAKFLGELGALLVDFHAANDQLDLAAPARQLEMLDRYAGLEKERTECRRLCVGIAALDAERAAFEKDALSPEKAREFGELVDAVDRVAPAPGEEEQLAGRYRLISNAREVLVLCGKLRDLLAEAEESVVDRLGEAHRLLAELSRFGEGGDATEKLLGSCDELQQNAEELSRQVGELAEKIDLDGEALHALESRIGEIHALKRRCGVSSEEELLDKAERARECLAAFGDAEKRRADLDGKKRELQEKLQRVSEKLSAHRKKAAKELVEAVRKNLADIGFEKCFLDAEFTGISPDATGCDRIELIFCANSGETPRPLRRIASSGELSRFMLALKTVLADADDIPTVVFDEIDMNIGGETAHGVGEKLRALGKHRQIFCISHLAQVAARADHHYQVVKISEKGRTFSRIVPLVDPVPELARMLGGGASAMRHAADLAASVGRRKEK